MTTLEKIRAQRSEILAIAEKYGATNLRVFGSVVHQEERPDSDIDLVVDWNDYHLFDRIHMQQELGDFFGRKVDLCVSKTLHWYIKDRILNEARPI